MHFLYLKVVAISFSENEKWNFSPACTAVSKDPVELKLSWIRSPANPLI